MLQPPPAPPPCAPPAPSHCSSSVGAPAPLSPETSSCTNFTPVTQHVCPRPSGDERPPARTWRGTCCTAVNRGGGAVAADGGGTQRLLTKELMGNVLCDTSQDPFVFGEQTGPRARREDGGTRQGQLDVPPPQFVSVTLWNTMSPGGYGLFDQVPQQNQCCPRCDLTMTSDLML